MRAKRLRFTPEAREDLASIRSRLSAVASPRIAGRIIERIREHITALRETPELASPRPEYGEGCRFSVAGPYVIYFSYDGADMIVLRVLHQARDRDEIMGGGGQ